MSRRGAALVFLVAFFLAPLNCRKASGTVQDPVEPEAEEALVEYLRIDTTNPPGNETRGAAFLRDRLQEVGIAVQLVGDDPARQAVYARLASGSPGKALLLLSHIDVVPADGTAWRNPPFAGKREGGYIWGRGALDMKSFTIAELMAVLDLKRRGAKLRRDVIFLATPDEERGGVNGVKKLLETRPDLFANVGFVLNEGGSNETALDRVQFWGIEVQQKVPLWLRIVAESQGGHGAAGGKSATASLVRALAAIDAIETPYRLSEPVERLAALGAAVRGPGKGARLRMLRAPLDVVAIERDLPPGYRALLRDTITITTLSAGSVVNVVPSRATAEVDIRLLPGSSSEEMLERVRAAVRTHAKVEVILAGEPAPESPGSGELFDSLRRVFTEAEPGAPIAPVITPATTDSRYFRARGIVTYGIAPFKVNYYDADSVHSTDERIRARFFAEGVRVMRKIVWDFCEVQGDSPR